MAGAARIWDGASGPALVGLGGFACALLGIEMTRHAGNVASLWIANAVLLAALVTQPAARWPALAAAFLAGNAGANLLEGDTVPVSLSFGAINAGEAVLGAWIFRRVSSGPPDFERMPQLLAFALAAGLVAPLAGATGGAGLVALAYDAPYFAVWPTWFAGDSLGNLTLAPLLTLLIRARDPRRRPGGARPTRLLSSALLVALACAAVFLQTRFPLLFLVVPAAIVATHRSGPLGAALSVLLVAAVGGAATLLGLGPMALIDGGMPTRILVFQLLLVTLLVVTLPLATLLAERRALVARLREAALRDDLTGLANRAGLMAELDPLLASTGAAVAPPSLLLIDIDHFKAVNDAHGHLVGDHVLEAVARSLRAGSREGDLPARLGGEEFVVLLPRTPLAEAHRIGERLRRAVEERIAPGHPFLPRVTVSAGAAEAAWGEDAQSLLARADRALYAAKSAGRNRVELAA